MPDCFEKIGEIKLKITSVRHARLRVDRQPELNAFNRRRYAREGRQYPQCFFDFCINIRASIQRQQRLTQPWNQKRNKIPILKRLQLNRVHAQFDGNIQNAVEDDSLAYASQTNNQETLFMAAAPDSLECEPSPVDDFGPSNQFRRLCSRPRRKRILVRIHF